MSWPALPTLCVVLLLVAPLAATALSALIGRLIATGEAARPHGPLQISRMQARQAQEVVTFLTCALSLGLTLLLIGPVTEEPVVSLYAMHVDALSVYFVLLVNVVALFASLYIGPYLDALGERHAPVADADPTRFHVLFNLFHLTMVFVPMVDNLVYLWIAVEFTTVFSTLLIGFRRDQRALEAAWKYIIITSTGIIFALLGTLFLANAIPEGGHPTMNWSQLIPLAKKLDQGFVRLSFLFILVGYGTKAGFAPMHPWLPDGHGEAPYPVSALLSGVLLKSALYAILRFYSITNLCLDDNGDFTSSLLLASGLFSLVVAAPFILKRNRFKRVLAYHSLEHMGIITFGIGIGTDIALFGALLHALNHALTKALMFLTFGQVQASYGTDIGGENEERYVGVLRSMPITGVLLALGGLALVGSPPFNIFLSEFIILGAAISKAAERGSGLALTYGAAIVLFVSSVTLIFVGLVRHLGRMLIDNPPDGVKRESRLQLVPLFVLLVVVLAFGLTIPSPGWFNLLLLVQQSATIVRCGGSICP